MQGRRLPPDTVAAIRADIDAGIPDREIARQRGCSRAAVYFLRRPDKDTRAANRQASRRLGKGEARLDPPRRCPSCRGLITVAPCRLCGLRRYVEATQRQARA